MILCRETIGEIKATKCFAVLADEASDVTAAVQLCLTIRPVNERYVAFEEPMGLFHVPQTDTNTLCSVLKDITSRCSLPVALCRGQTYDGAEKMSGHLKDVAASFKSEVDQLFALQVYCLAHSMNLCLQDA